MDYKDLLKNRRSIRDFEDAQVPLEIVKEIIQETTLAPTASNVQPCRFIIIRDRALIKQLSDDSKRNQLMDLERAPNSRLEMYAGALRNESFNVFYNSPCLVFVIGPKTVLTLDFDSAMTVAYFMFSATQRGLGTCWINLGANIRDPQLLTVIGIPEDCRIVAPIILGYPKSIPPVSKRHDADIIKII